jgi:hypothetical protein
MDGVRKVPYGLPQLIEAIGQSKTIFVVEGENCADAVIALGGAATCNAMGAGKWPDELTPFFKNADVVVLPDNDDPGAKHAALLLEKLQGTAQRVRVLQLLGLPPKGDIADWIEAGGTLEQLHALVEADSSDAPKDATSANAAKAKQPAAFRMGSKGLVWVDPSDNEKPEIVISGPFEVIAESQDDAGYSWGVLLRWKDPVGRSKDWAMPRSLLAGDGLDVRRVLLDGGLYISASGKARSLLTTYLASVHVKTRAKAVASTGWFGSAFVLPDSTIGLAKDEAVILQTPHFVGHAYNVRGSLDDWKENVARLSVGNSRLVLAMSAGFAAALVGPCGAESGGIHFRGRSSIGKTTALGVAGSVWGGGDRGFIRSWRATSNGIEGTAVIHSDALLCLDEISQLSGKEAGEVAYMLANGQGKARASRDATLRKPARWRLLFLSTGEIGLADKIAEDMRGRRQTAGQAVRVIDLPSDAGVHGYSRRCMNLRTRERLLIICAAHAISTTARRLESSLRRSRRTSMRRPMLSKTRRASLLTIIAPAQNVTGKSSVLRRGLV